jgi:predicted negative regulator of RcsB-dependent stress response
VSETTHISISVGLLIALAGTLVWVGRQAQRIDQLEKDAIRLDAVITNVSVSLTSKMDKMIENLDVKLDKIWEFLRALATRRSSGSKPPL